MADDNPINQKLTDSILAERGVHVSTAATGHEAVVLAQKQTFDLILMDMHMPVMSGLEATKRIRHGNGPNARIPVVAVTADVLPDNHRRIFAAGMDEILLKPVDEDELARTIARFCGVHEIPPGETQGDSSADDPGLPQAQLPVHDMEAALRFSGGNEEIVREMINMLLATVDEDAQAIALLASQCTWDALWDNVHRLHGAAAACGVRALHNVLGRMENAVRQRDPEQVNTLVAEMLVQSGRVKILQETP